MEVPGSGTGKIAVLLYVPGIKGADPGCPAILPASGNTFTSTCNLEHKE